MPAAAGPFPPSFLEAVDGRLWTQFRVSQVLADRYGITREEMDAYALASHRRAAQNWDSGHFEREAVPVPIKAEDGSLTGESPPHGRGHPAHLHPRGAGGAAARPELGARDRPRDHGGQLVAGDRRRGGHAHCRAGHGRGAGPAHPPPASRTSPVAADDAAIVLSAPVPVTHKLLKRSGMTVDQFDAVECNEAFAAIALMWQKEFGYDMERFNPRGGAIALGHPLGASGVRLMGTLLNHLEATGGRYGYQTMCEGGGQANGTVIERLG